MNIHAADPLGDQLSRLAGLTNTLANVATLSWVSCTALIAAVMGAVWYKRNDLRNHYFLSAGAVAGGVVLMHYFIDFGVRLTGAGTDLAGAYEKACEAADSALCVVGGETAMIHFVPTGFWYGTVIWRVILALWIGLWLFIFFGNPMSKLLAKMRRSLGITVKTKECPPTQKGDPQVDIPVVGGRCSAGTGPGFRLG
ncbi:MAG: hypothetical protein LBC97_07680 [Bifidobacteriaceae bacterium]|jgi:hypothetical protein|nr:hypothetical protein [Bifidobacteriaceae bacterium]